MSDINKQENKKSEYKYSINPYQYRIKVNIDTITAPVGSFPWAVIQVYFGNKLYRKNWNSPTEYVRLIPSQSNNDEIYIEKNDRYDQWMPWLPTPQDLMACDWDFMKKTNLENSMLVFDLELDSRRRVGGVKGWGYEAYGNSFGTLNIIENNTDIVKIGAFMWIPEDDKVLFMAKSIQPDSSDESGENEESNQRMRELFKKGLDVMVDGVTYSFGKPSRILASGIPDIFSYYEHNIEAKKLGEILKQKGQTKRFYLTWRDY
ncbi:DUF2829 domain-containing protein [Xenorhabdus bovienii]|uniref:Thoeris anti-defense Tad2 family protein n=1 Tax=Xenorhabdus bovienii TaxID=40576 RepID=UPI0023B2737B|nr:MW1434 family type I TA system toxin [Xenorhabdus bovienii]MDE9564425.1 DUF2829 domain-containing protein [Xenorhabdus bovienii]